jgi:hypothetical protein
MSKGIRAEFICYFNYLRRDPNSGLAPNGPASYLPVSRRPVTAAPSSTIENT